MIFYINKMSFCKVTWIFNLSDKNSASIVFIVLSEASFQICNHSCRILKQFSIYESLIIMKQAQLQLIVYFSCIQKECK